MTVDSSPRVRSEKTCGAFILLPFARSQVGFSVPPNRASVDSGERAVITIKGPFTINYSFLLIKHLFQK